LTVIYMCFEWSVCPTMYSIFPQKIWASLWHALESQYNCNVNVLQIQLVG